MSERSEEEKLKIAGAITETLATPEEICERIMHMAIHAGFPAAAEGMAAAKSLFDASTVD